MIRTAIVNIIFCYFSVACFSQEEVIKLNVKAGNTYVFEVKSINSEISLNGNSQIAYKSNARVHFEVETINKDSITYTAQTVYYQAENADTPIKSITDYIFPPIGYDEIENQNIYWVIIRILSTMKIKYKADLKTNEIKLNNQELFFDEVRKKLKALGYNEELISRRIDYFNEKNSILEHVNHKNQILLYFNQARKINSSQINSPFLNKTLTKSKKGEYFFSEDNSEFGTNYSKLTLNKKTGFLEQYIEAKNDTNYVKWIGTNIHSKLTETVYTFKEQFETNKDLFTFKCTIKNPQDSIVTIMFLDKPYGDDYSKKLLKLDENNQVTFQTKIQAPSFFYFASKSIKYTPKWVSSYYYIEPRDTLILNINGTEENSLDISGTNSHVNKILRDLQKEEELFLYPGILSIPDISKRSQNPTQKFNSYLKNNNITLKNDIYSFLNTELVAIEYYFYFALLNKHHSPLQRSSFPFQNIETEKKMVAIAKEKIEDFDIHDNYNDYGIYSRKMSKQYFNYYLNNLGRIQVNSSMSSKHSLIKEFEVGKMILGGSVFYRVLADRVVSSIKKDHEYLIPPATYNLPDAIELLNLLTKQSNSEHYKQNLITFRNNRLNWENKNYIPDETFYKPDGSKLKLQEVINGKPTVLLISENWGAYRYNLDEEAKKNPEIQYIMIVEGDNIVEWQKYLQRAAPVADQLFYLNENKSLDEIFLTINKLYAVYDKDGALIGYDVEQDDFTKVAKASLKKKKELNKSQLLNIIILLLFIISILILAIVIYKWKSRQRFRKEEQKRKIQELELTAIRSQMNPHFLFNSLNSVQSLVQQNKGREVHLYLSDFAGLIRKVLQNSKKEEVSLDEELEMTRQYLNLEKLRFEFEYTIFIEDKIDIYSTEVPSMLLQTFIENAVIHGLQNKSKDRNLKIDIKSVEQGIKIIIEDNGIGRDAAKDISKAKNGMGLKLIKDRLEVLEQKNGEKYSINITDLKDEKTGTRVEILVPDDN